MAVVRANATENEVAAENRPAIFNAPSAFNLKHNNWRMVIKPSGC